LLALHLLLVLLHILLHLLLLLFLDLLILGLFTLLNFLEGLVPVDCPCVGCCELVVRARCRGEVWDSGFLDVSPGLVEL
jgi:hypothetical protein